MRFVIIGFMAAGKTTVARALARGLSCDAVDLDAAVSEHEGRTIHDLICERGEDAFRRAETSVLRAVLEKSEARVIALGGGAWTIEENRALIAEHGCLTIWLDAPFSLCWRRIDAEKGVRPLAPDRRATHKLYRERRSLYELAALRLRLVKGESADEVAAKLLRATRRLEHL